MKKLFLSIALAGLLLAGCTNQNSLVGPEPVSQQQAPAKQFVPMPQNTHLSVEGSVTVSKEIDGSRGGFVVLLKRVDDITVFATLYVPRGAFEGTENISITVNNDGTVEFGPNGLEFKKDLRFDYFIQGLELQDSEYVFGFLGNDGSIQTLVDYAHISVNHRLGILSVRNAKISHFSRYGFAT